MNRALMERWLSFKKRFKACLKEPSILPPSERSFFNNRMQLKLKDNPTFTSKPLSFWKK
ncbi:hypothetical protein [Helicobacter pylori]|uniref:hypothetical protein n=1 Tax=Helicobacter pylori TaxID=210 RepID=UPI0012FDA714|nr:hypothetical protein [Helicobacter pylori]